MPIAHIFNGLDGHQISQHAGVQDLFDFPVEGGVAQNMADHHLPAGLPSHGQNFFALGKIRRNGLLHENVIALAQGGNGLGDMLPVLGAEHQGVSQARPGQERFGAVEAALRRDSELLGDLMDFGGIRVCDGHDFGPLRHLGQGLGVGVLSPATQAGDGDGDNGHRAYLPITNV